MFDDMWHLVSLSHYIPAPFDCPVSCDDWATSCLLHVVGALEKHKPTPTTAFLAVSCICLRNVCSISELWLGNSWLGANSVPLAVSALFVLTSGAYLEWLVALQAKVGVGVGGGWWGGARGGWDCLCVVCRVKGFLEGARRGRGWSSVGLGWWRSGGVVGGALVVLQAKGCGALWGRQGPGEEDGGCVWAAIIV